MRYLSVCSGIEAASVAWEPLGWTPAAFAEIERFPSAVLAHHYPKVRNLGDITKSHDWKGIGAIDILAGGTPCQSFSVAGLREGLRDPRGNLALRFLAVANQCRPSWVVWENVPGVLSCNGGRDFGSFLGGLAQLGYGWAYRVLDAQFFGIPQRRRRVFVVGYLGNWRRAAEVLFEPACLSGDPPPCREARQGIAGALTGSASKRSAWRCGPDEAAAGHLIMSHDPACTLTAREYKGPLPEADLSTVVAYDTTQITSGTNRSNPQPGAPCHTLAKRDQPPVLAFRHSTGPTDTGAPQVERTPTLRAADASGLAIAFQSSQSGVREVAAHPTLDANNGSRRHNGVVGAFGVRRLTPRECERLQGFPDDYTRIPQPFFTKLLIPPDPDNPKHWVADGPRYRALGNSMAVPVVRWLGQRLEAVHKAYGKNH